MRSRYVAYALGLEAYLLASWHPDTRPAVLGLADEVPVKWLGLQIRTAAQDGDTAQVHFVARYKVAGRAHRLEERSRFLRVAGVWLYLDGEIISD